MSKYDWEAGEIQIPARSWATLRKSLIDEWNRLQHRVFALATDAYQSIQNTPKPEDALTNWLYPAADKHPGAYRHPSYEEREHHGEAIRRLLFRWNDTTRQSVLRCPLKMHLDIKSSRQGCVLYFAGASITFDERTKAVAWAVGEGNRAVEHARQHPMAKALFSALGRVRWCRGSGGDIVGNDEYNRDQVGAGGGANYVTGSFGLRSTRGLTLPRARRTSAS
jgi:hypothetical protein